MPNNIMPESINKLPLGTMFRLKREEKGLLIRQVAAVTELDQAIISRIENNDRLPTREQLIKLAGLYNMDLKETTAAWLAEKMVRDYGHEPYAPEAFREAHDQVMFSLNMAASPTAEYKPSFSDEAVNRRKKKPSAHKPGIKPDTENS